MSRIIKIAVVAVLLSSSCKAQPFLQEAYQIATGEEAVGGFQTSDGGYRFTSRNGGSNPNTFICQTNALGSLIWSKFYTSYSGNLIALASAETNDNGAILTGYYYTDSTNVFLMKTDSLGNAEWFRIYVSSFLERGNWVQQTSDGGYIITGITSPAFGSAAFVIKTDSLGNITWSRDFANMNIAWGQCIRETANGDFILAGMSDSSGISDACLTRVDGAGNVIWSYSYGGNNGDVAYSVAEDASGNFIVTGETFITIGPNSAINHIFLFKTDAQGNLLWSRMYGSNANDVAFDVLVTQNGDYLITGFTTGFVGNSLVTSNLFLIKTSSNGLYQWCKYYGGNVNSNDWGTRLFENQSGDFVALGRTSAGSYLLTTDVNGNTICNGYSFPLNPVNYYPYVSPNPGTGAQRFFNVIADGINVTPITPLHLNPCTVSTEEHIEEVDISVFPNPSDGVCHITGVAQNDQYEIMDVMGEVVLQGQVTSSDVMVNLGDCSPGVYFLTIKRNSEILKYTKILHL